MSKRAIHKMGNKSSLNSGDLKLKKQQKEEAVLKNGRQLLEERIGTCYGKDNPIRIFSADQIQQAIEDFDKRYTSMHKDEWHEGILDDRLVLIKDYNKHAYRRITEAAAYHNISVSSMMSSHSNVLKLLGCCLELPLPALVFEYAEKGRLDYCGGIDDDESLPWKIRMKIAKQIASAVAYMHTAFPRPIIHRDIKPTNVFLDHNYAAKLSTFSWSVSIPEGKTQVEVEDVVGTIGFLDPACLYTLSITEKTDVYSFGISLLVLLTGKSIKDICISADDIPSQGGYADNSSLYKCIRRLIEENLFNGIVDPAIWKDVSGAALSERQQQLRACLDVVLKCTTHAPEDRPSMVEIAKQLLSIERSIL